MTADPNPSTLSLAKGPSSVLAPPDRQPLVERWRTAVRFGGPEVRARRREHLFYAGVKQGGAVVALAYIAVGHTGWVEWSGFAVFYVLNILAMSLGYHRYFAHRAFECSRPMRYALAALAQFGTYGSLKRWCADHRRHHDRADRPGDIHSPHVGDQGERLTGAAGIRHAHLGWAYGDALTNMQIYGKDIVGDPVIEWAHATRYIWFAVSIAGLPALWGLVFAGPIPSKVLGTVLVAGFLRGAVALHAIAAVNSFGHKFGYRNYPGAGQARNNIWLGYITLGEGWHNNHHAQPRSASNQLRRFEIDMTGWLITGLERLGLVWNVQHRR